jgi:hypothetical protein
MVEMPGLYFVIANDARARFVRPGLNNHPHTIRTINFDLFRQPADGNGAAGSGDAARALARIIDDEFSVDLFSDLVLVAPSHLSVELMAALAAATRESVLGTVSADLLDVPDAGLRPHLAAWLPPVTQP